MKRILLYILLLALLLAILSACSSGSSESGEDGSYGSASGAGDTGGPGNEDEQYEASLLESGDLVERYDPEEDGYYIEEEQTPEDAEADAEAQALEAESAEPDGYVPEGEVLAGEPYTVMEGVTEIPRKDRRYVCGFATHVFVGEVVEETTTLTLGAEHVEGETDPPPLPATQYIVKLDPDTSLVKGTWEPGSQVTASDAVTTGYIVNQIGGDNAGNGLELMEGDPLLIPGERYLFATNYDAVNNWYWIVVQPEGDVRIDSDSQRDRLIRDFKKGCKYEVTFDDVLAAAEENEDLSVEEQYSSGEDPDYVLRVDDPGAGSEEE